jgi:hypothetical protein
MTIFTMMSKKKTEITTYYLGLIKQYQNPVYSDIYFKFNLSTFLLLATKISSTVSWQQQPVNSITS